MTNQFPKVTVDPRGCIFSVVGANESIPLRFLSSFRASQQPRVAVFGGGVKNFTEEAIAKMAPWVLAGFKGFRGVALSGGTAYFDSTTGKLKSEIVTAIPAILSAENECIAIGTFPRVEELALDREKHFVLTDTYGAVVDDRYHHIASIQKNAAETLDWDGDLAQRFSVLDMLKDWKRVYVIINGGPVTRDEAYMALEHGIDVVVAKNSFREADALVAAVERDDFSDTAKEQRTKAKDDAVKLAAVDAIVERCKSILKDRKHLVHVVEYGDQEALRAKMVELNIVEGAQA